MTQFSVATRQLLVAFTMSKQSHWKFPLRLPTQYFFGLDALLNTYCPRLLAWRSMVKIRLETWPRSESLMLVRMPLREKQGQQSVSCGVPSTLKQRFLSRGRLDQAVAEHNEAFARGYIT